jgi:NAD(P)H-hydrate epimerase
MSEAHIEKLASLFEETAEAHHRAFAETNGEDPEWPWWYAGHLQDKLNEMLAASLTKSEVVYLVVAAEKERSERAPDAAWPHYYAKYLLERHS